MARQESPFHMQGRFSAGRTQLSDIARGIYRERGLPVWTMNYTEAGRGLFAGPTGQFTTEVGDLVLVEPGALNDYGPDPETAHWTHLWTTFQPEEDWLHLLGSWSEVIPGHRRLRPQADGDNLDRIRQACIDLTMIAEGAWPERDALGISVIHTTLLWCATANPNARDRFLDQRIRRATRILCRQLDHPWTLDELAAAVGLSTSRCAHLFREQVGQSPMAYLETHRIHRACDLLLMGDRSINTIAQQVGYPDPAYFGRVFKKHVNQTPRGFRQMRRS